MAGSDWVWLTVIGPTGAMVAEMRRSDSWYRLGGHQHPDRHQAVRDQQAKEELYEWFRRHEPPSGSYVMWVAEMSGPHAEQRGKTWASVKLTYTAPLAKESHGCPDQQ